MRRIMRGFFSGFTATAVLLSAVIICILFMSRAEQQTKWLGFSDNSPSTVFSLDPDEKTVTLFGLTLWLE